MPGKCGLIPLMAACALAGCAASPASRVAAAPSSGPGAADNGASDGTTLSGQEQQESEHKARQINRAWGWVFISVGAEGALVATVTSVMMLHANSIRSADCVNKICSSAGLDANNTIGNLSGWNVGAWALAGLGTVAGVYFLLTNPSDKALHAEVGAGSTGSGSGLVLRATF